MNPLYVFNLILALVAVLYIILTLKPNQKFNDRFREMGLKGWGIVILLSVCSFVLVITVF